MLLIEAELSMLPMHINLGYDYVYLHISLWPVASLKLVRFLGLQYDDVPAGLINVMKGVIAKGVSCQRSYLRTQLLTRAHAPLSA